MIAVIGVDASLTRTGLARADGRLVSIVPKAGANDRARRLFEIVSVFRRNLPTGEAGAVIERYNPRGQQGYTMAHLAELGGVLRLVLFEFAIPWVEVPPSTLKKFATGKGNADKDAMVAAARAAGADPANHDEADAFWLRRYGIEEVSW